jgi:predicted RNA-binding protein YlqC (UPF0109 family)
VKELLTVLAQVLVDDPDRVRVRETSENGVLFLELRVSAEDRGKVIGKRGRTADALRTILDVVARQRGERCEMEIVD